MEGTEKNIMKDYNYGELDIKNGPRIYIQRYSNTGWFPCFLSAAKTLLKH